MYFLNFFNLVKIFAYIFSFLFFFYFRPKPKIVLTIFSCKICCNPFLLIDINYIHMCIIFSILQKKEREGTTRADLFKKETGEVDMRASDSCPLITILPFLLGKKEDCSFGILLSDNILR